MQSISLIRCLPAAVLIWAVLCCGVASAGTLTYAIGDKVALSGKAYATNTLFIFVTGPGLDPGGVNPSQMKSPVVNGDPSTFVQIDVVNDRWSYTWNTAHQGFSLREGTYTIYIVSIPVSKNALPSAYDTIDISLTRSGETFPGFGTINITTSPPGAAIYIDSQFAGIAPKSLTVSLGTHTIRIESPGYMTIIDSVPVNGDTEISMKKILVPVATITTTTVSLTTQAPMATLVPVSAGPTTTVAVPLHAGFGILAIIGAALLRQSNRKR